MVNPINRTLGGYDVVTETNGLERVSSAPGSSITPLPKLRSEDELATVRSLSESVASANEQLGSRGTRLSLEIDPDSQRAIITVRNRITNEVLVQVPSVVTLALEKQIETLTGIILDTRT